MKFSRLFIVFSILCGVTGRPNNGSKGTKILILQHIVGSFVEDSTLIFSCIYLGDSKVFNLQWFLRDAKSGLEPFYFNIPGAHQVVWNQTYLAIDLVARRDFSYMDLVCESDTKNNATFQLPKIENVLPVEDLILHPNLVLGERIRIWCDIKFSGKFRKAGIFDGNELTPFTSHYSIENNWMRYEALFKKRADMAFDGKRIQCIWISKNLSEPQGNVHSQIAVTLVHYAELRLRKLAAKTVVDLGENVIRALDINARPPPSDEKFQAVMYDKYSPVCFFPAKVDITAISDKRFVSFANFRPEKNGTYRLAYTVVDKQNVSTAFNITVVNPEISSLSTLGNIVILSGNGVHIKLQFRSKSSPRKSFLKMRRIWEEEDIRCADNIADPTRIQVFKNGSNKFIINMFVLPVATGDYRLDYQVGGVIVKGPMYRFSVIEDNFLLMILLLSIMGVTLVVGASILIAFVCRKIIETRRGHATSPESMTLDDEEAKHLPARVCKKGDAVHA